MAKHPVRFGIQTGQQNVAWSDLLELWRGADSWGYDTLWAFDHFYPIFSDPSGPCYEGWTALAALAQSTKNARIGHLVTGNTYRHPSVTAKMAMTLDHISGGRLNLGIGAGWFELEHESLGFDFKTVLGRLEALDESLQIIKGMLAGDKVTLDGKHYQVKDAVCQPLPVQPDGIPVMIGGTGRKVLLRIVAQHADMWNAAGTADTLRELVDVLGGHCQAVGRDPDEIEKTVMMPFCYTADKEKQDLVVQLLSGAFDISPEDARAQTMIGERDECLEKVAQYVEAGCTHFIFMLFAPYFPDEIQAFAEDVIPAARSM